MSTTRFLWLIVYRVRDANRAAKVRDWARFQGRVLRPGVCETWATQSGLRQALLDVSYHLSPEDQVYVYRICADCREDCRFYGVDPPGAPEAAIIF
ncbi:MAG: hypothetical protein IT350_15300 [Deltaproteobacteria bacterium]|nr:hypothetical protein [Deltaproteobacteria bacterium]